MEKASHDLHEIRVVFATLLDRFEESPRRECEHDCHAAERETEEAWNHVNSELHPRRSFSLHWQPDIVAEDSDDCGEQKVG